MSALFYARDYAEWFAIQVWVGREHVCEKHLRLRGYEVFLPCYLEYRRWSDRTKKVTRPLFSGYVFCQLQPGVAGKIVETPGVIRIVGDGRAPVPVSAKEVDAIQRIVQTGLTPSPWPFLREGQRVRLERGPLLGAEGTVLKIKNKHRLIVSISLLQRSVAVEIDPEWVSIPPLALVQPGTA